MSVPTGRFGGRPSPSEDILTSRILAGLAAAHRFTGWNRSFMPVTIFCSRLEAHDIVFPRGSCPTALDQVQAAPCPRFPAGVLCRAGCKF